MRLKKSVPVIKNEIKELEEREIKQRELAKNKKKREGMRDRTGAKMCQLL